MTRLIATFLGVGLLRLGPGTWASMAALPVAWALHALGGFPALAVATVVVFFLGWWATAVQIRGKTDHDPGEIVIDEVVGQWIALWPVSLGAWAMDAEIIRLWPGWVVAFVAFRMLDIWKPGPIGWADRRADALGVMLDDVIAGILAALVVLIGAALAHLVLLI